MLSSSIFGLVMSGGVAAAATDTKSVLEVVAIAEVDFGGILGTRAGAVAVGMTSDCKVLFTAQDALQFASGGASDGRARQKLAAMIQTDGVPEGFHRGRWKPVNGPREGGGLMRSSLRPRVMCGIRDSSHKHMHTQYTHTHTHTHTRTHTHTHKYIHTHTPTPVARSCVLSLSRNLSISLSLGVPACVSGGGDALLAGADENSWQSRPRHACASSALTWAAPTTVQKHCPRKRHTLMAGSSAYAHGRHC